MRLHLLPLLLCLVSRVFTPTHAAQRTLMDFQSVSSPAAWESGEGLITPASTPSGMVLTLDFPRDDRQLQLRKPVRWDLSDLDSFRLRLGVARSQRILEATLAFKSGNGWYRHPFTLHSDGPRHVLLPRSGFTSIGSPAGWNRIEAVRLSFWPRSVGRALVTPTSLEGFTGDLWLVDPEPLARGADEIYTARVAKRHVAGLLTDLGLPHAVSTLDAPPTAAPPKLILLPYAPRLSAARRGVLLRQLAAGAKLIVFETADPELARALGVRLGPTVTSNTVGQFDHLRFAGPDSGAWPETLYQSAWNFQSLEPLSGSRILATWTDARGRDLRHPAAVLGPAGAWFNVAWRSGDTRAKGRVLGGLIGELAPGLLREAVRYQMETRSPAAFEQRHGSIGNHSKPGGNLRRQAERLFDSGRGLARAGNFREAHKILAQSHNGMERAFAASRKSWNADIRGVWDQQGTGWYTGGWDETCRELKKAGFNAVFSNMATAGRAHYPSKHIPPSKTLELYGDQLKAFSAAARKHGLRAHAWKICWKLNTRDPAFLEKMRRERRLMADASGREIPWLSISDPRNLQHEIDSLLEILRHAPLDGVQLDYMRYPGREADYGPAARKAFEAELGRPLPDWPKEVLGPLKDRYQRFRQQQLHHAVRAIHRAVKREFPATTLSAAVWGAWPDCADAQGQDWPVWAREGWIDMLIPMNYTDNPDQLAGWLDLQRAQPGVAERLVPGLGLISTNAELGSAQLLEQLELARERRLPGAVIYRLDSSLPDRVFPFLKLWRD